MQREVDGKFLSPIRSCFGSLRVLVHRSQAESSFFAAPPATANGTNELFKMLKPVIDTHKTIPSNCDKPNDLNGVGWLRLTDKQ